MRLNEVTQQPNVRITDQAVEKAALKAIGKTFGKKYADRTSLRTNYTQYKILQGNGNVSWPVSDKDFMWNKGKKNVDDRKYVSVSVRLSRDYDNFVDKADVRKVRNVKRLETYVQQIVDNLMPYVRFEPSDISYKLGRRGGDGESLTIYFYL